MTSRSLTKICGGDLQNRVGFLPEETYFFQDTWKKLEKTGSKWFFHFIPEESGRNWNKVKDITRVNV